MAQSKKGFNTLSGIRGFGPFGAGDTDGDY